MAEQTFDLFARREKRIYRVRELTRELKGLVEGRFPAILVEGEISNFRRHSASGHCYFTLKDDGAALRCVLFRSQAKLLRFGPADGQQVLARGRLSVYEPGGEVSLVCDSLTPQGAGALALKLEELKRALQAEGLFDLEKKRPLPFIPRRVGVVTSPTGAAIHDFLLVLSRRWPSMPVLIAPARVQGDGAAAEVCRGIARLSAIPDVDVIVVTRGGGSLEDLWTFNEEAVVRAIRRSPVPVVSAVGHEVDVTLSDLAADARAPTPSAAASLVVPVRDELAEQLRLSRGRLARAWRGQLDRRRAGVVALRRGLSDPRRLVGERRYGLDRLFARAEKSLQDRLGREKRSLLVLDQALGRAHPRSRLAAWRERMSKLEERSARLARGRLAREKEGLSALAGRLDALSPLKVLGRGYALAYGAQGELIQDAAALQLGSPVRVRVAKGSFEAQVTEVRAEQEAPGDAD